MSEFGKAVFSDSPFIRWTLAPVSLFCALLFSGFVVGGFMSGDVVATLIGIGLTSGCFCFFLCLVSRRFFGTSRIVTSLIFLSYLCYLGHEWLFELDEGIGIGNRRSAASPINALLGFIIIGIPCLWYTLLGRFTLHPEPPEEAFSEEDWLEEEYEESLEAIEPEQKQ